MTEVTLAVGDDRVVIDPDDGGRLVSAVLGGHERLMSGPEPDVDPSLTDIVWGTFVMAPWAGRIEDGALEWEGATHRLEPRMQGHAIHGVCSGARWTVVEHAEDRAVLRCDLAANGWPFGGEVRHEVALDRGRLSFVLTVLAGDRSMPSWIGWHPCFRRPVDGDVSVQIDADGVLVTEEMIPTGHVVPVHGDTDLRQGPPLGDRRLDHTFLDAVSPARITWPDLALDLSFGDTTACVVVFTPEHQLCVEPQTGWPDALRLAERGLDTGVARLAPGEQLTASMDWRWFELD